MFALTCPLYIWTILGL
nr:hypothetical protein [Lacrimispora saccharolytica]